VWRKLTKDFDAVTSLAAAITVISKDTLFCNSLGNGPRRAAVRHNVGGNANGGVNRLEPGLKN
jgi:hypothetical protein